MLESLIYDWNKIGAPAKPARVMLDDETLRDGLQSPSVRTPTIGRKIEILHLIDKLGIDTADIGLPGAGRGSLMRVIVVYALPTDQEVTELDLAPAATVADATRHHSAGSTA